MTQAPPAETMSLRIVSCETCDQLFLVSPRRETCPGCGGGPGLEFFSFEASPEGVQLVSSLTDADVAAVELEIPAEGAVAGNTVDQEEISAGAPYHAFCPGCGASLRVSVTDTAVAVEVSNPPGPEPDDVPEAPTLTESPPETP